MLCTGGRCRRGLNDDVVMGPRRSISTNRAIIPQRHSPPRIHDEEKGYYADGEDAYDMRKYFNKPSDEGKTKKGGDIAGEMAKLSLAGEAAKANGVAPAEAGAGAGEAEAVEAGEK